MIILAISEKYMAISIGYACNKIQQKYIWIFAFVTVHTSRKQRSIVNIYVPARCIF